ncbi:molybdopterin-guanine dinucleotide biosynthesis protein B [Grimontia hollisae]|uniref:Molybdopterin-guanine dinucleotide biosynthesis protein B n=1 Tax=Grimontia hollisae CIP 101886 TaxID=675812 RepID=D0I6F9_GRIHO|nr:molybdopterin-guanine dinucleotide biosynthesis protein B [Grimontia hollisae]AMG31580.1 molybdopterin-guanine dinucleotide biosynthesis protein B [Grimontia hollisae]EEY72228.1 molybdopterin-guanine dinucleotide biosynthesis protein B [Grimontia hollisae CIP 101886]MDF2185951.1 molybdopterin-guanine dinucleotide biosynthesis protein B [Grimontia hollisae]STO45307.1 Molybdopterin-guanine dinucleotide biosynthesis protein B [Grimontia hollisae]STQ76342.1 Molybdopterin-guanine dinucleotide bi
MPNKQLTPVLGFAGYSGAGKTTLLEAVIPHLKTAGLKVGLLKHSHHDIEPDNPSKDSYRLRYAGSDQLLLATSKRHMLFFEYHDQENREPSLKECLAQLDHARLDIILVEGFRDEKFAKIEVHRPRYGKPTLYSQDKHIIAVAYDEKPTDFDHSGLPALDLNQAANIAAFIKYWLKNAPIHEKYLAYEPLM